MRPALLSAVVLVVVAACQESPAAVGTPGPVAPRLDAAQTATVSQDIPINVSLFWYCANGGAGETIQLSGTLHDVFHYTLTANTLVMDQLDNPQSLSGVGLTTGDRFQATGMTRSSITSAIGGLPFTNTYVNNFFIIGQRTGNNFQVHETFHVTVNANGTITASVDNFFATCM